MSKILVEELKTSLEQDFTANKKHVLKSIRLWLYKHLSPSGNIYIEVIQGGQTIATSGNITSAYLEANTDATALNYSHGYIRFDFTDTFVILKGNFTVRLNSSGYSFSDSAYFGWVKPHENKLFTETYTNRNELDNTFGVQFWEIRERL